MTNERMCQLVEAIARMQDRQAFADLFAYFAPRVKAFGLRGGANAAAADELAQETMLSVWRKAGTFNPERATVSTWIFTIARNKRIDTVRRENYPEADLQEAGDLLTPEQSPDENVALSQAGDALRRAMQHLSSEQLQVLQKAFFEEKSHRAIAEEMQLPLGTVKSRIRLALAHLRLALTEEQA